MTCQSCVKSIKEALLKCPDVFNANVDLSSETGVIVVAPSLDPIQIIRIIEDSGFEAQLLGKATSACSMFVSIRFMTCQSCVNSITTALELHHAVKKAHVDLPSETGKIDVSGNINYFEIISIIEDAGFEAEAIDATTFHDLILSTKQRNKSTVSNRTLINPFLDSPSLETSGGIPLLSLTKGAKSSNDSIFNTTLSITLKVKGMTCASCVATIEKHLNSHNAIVSAKVALILEEASVEFCPELIKESELVQLINSIGFEASLMQTSAIGVVDLRIFGMTCGSCSGKIEREIKNMEGVISVSVNLLGQTGRFELDTDTIGTRDVVEKIESLGFNAVVADNSADSQLESLNRTREIQEWRRAFWTSLGLSIPVSLISMVLPRWIPNIINATVLIPGLRLGDLTMLILTIPIQFGIGMRFYRAAFKALSHRSYTMDVLITLGTTMAFLFSIYSMLHSIVTGGAPPKVFFETAAMLITFVVFGRYLENSAKAHTSSALSKLITLAPSYAILIQTNVKTGAHVEKKIPTEYIKKGDVLKIFPSERMPADGVVEFGSSNVDESLLTGEPIPLSKNIGDTVIAGSVNGNGVLHIRAERVGAETTLSQIVKLVSSAQTSKAPIQATADRIAAIFVPSVVSIAFITFLFWFIFINVTGWIPSSFPPDSDSLYVSLSICISVIVVACPCALGLATPTAIMVGRYNIKTYFR